MESRLFFGFVIGALLLAGCGKSDKGSATVGATTKPPVTADKSVDTPTKSDEKATVPKLPAELMHMGYEYSGLANDKPLKFKLVQQQGQPASTGEQTAKLKDVKDGVATYTVERSDGLAVLGSDEIVVTKDGVYTTKSSLGEMDSKNLELSSSLPVGKTWTEKHTLTQASGQKITIASTYKIVGAEKVKTEAGEFDALLITTEGPVEAGGQKLTLRGKAWFVKGIGVVKQMIRRSGAGKAVTMSIEMTK